MKHQYSTGTDKKCYLQARAGNKASNLAGPRSKENSSTKHIRFNLMHINFNFILITKDGYFLPVLARIDSTKSLAVL